MARTFYVALTITLNDEEECYGPPDEWDWPTLLDLPWDDVIFEDMKEITD